MSAQFFSFQFFNVPDLRSAHSFPRMDVTSTFGAGSVISDEIQERDGGVQSGGEVNEVGGVAVPGSGADVEEEVSAGGSAVRDPEF